MLGPLKTRVVSFVKAHDAALQFGLSLVALVITSVIANDDFVNWASERVAMELLAFVLLLCLGVYCIRRIADGPKTQ